jgi:O-antigen ligase
MKAENLFLPPESKNNKSFFLTLVLSAILFWLGLGVGDNMSDSNYWIQSTWTSIKLEWLFILTYMVMCQKLPTLKVLWGNYRFVTIVAILWLTTVILSYFISSHYNWQNSLATMRLIETITHFIFFLVIRDFFVRYSVDYRIIFSAVILSTLVVMGYFVYIHFAFPNLEADQHAFSMRSDELILNTHLHRIGYQVEATIAFSVAFIFFKKQINIAFFLMGTLFLFLLWLGGRAAILGSIVTLLVCFFWFRQNISLKALIGFGIFVLLLLSITIYFHLLNLDYFIHAVQKTFQADSLSHLLTGRIEVWSLVLEELQGHWLLGNGPQSYFFYLGRHIGVIHAHNFILQMLGEWGIAGTALFSVLLYKTVRYGIGQHLQKPNYTERYHLAAGLVMLSLTITGLFGGIYFFTQTSVYLAVAFALWVTPSNSKKSHKLNNIS